MPPVATSFRFASTDADLGLINTLFTKKVPAVAGTSIVDEMLAEGWPTTMPFTLAFWHPIMVDSQHNYIIMGFDGSNNLRGAGWWRINHDGVWDVALVGTDKALTTAQRTQGVSDCFQWNAARVDPATRFGGDSRLGGRIEVYLGSRLPASCRTVRGQIVHYECTAAQALQFLK